MKHMISTITLTETMTTETELKKIQKMAPYLVLLTVFYLLTFAALAQPPGSLPDPGNTYGPGSSVRTTQSTNPDSFIPETKTEFFDKNGTLKEERIKTKDLDGNNVTITKKYDGTGILRSRDEVRRDKIGVVYDEHMEYNDMGRITKGKKDIWEKGKWHIFKYDPLKEAYSNVSYARPVPKDACNCSKTELKIGYSYMKTSLQGAMAALPTGAELSINQRVGKHIGLVLDASGYQKQLPAFTFSRVSLQGGIQYDPKKCDDKDRISVFARIAIGMMHERSKTKITMSSATAASGTAELGANIRIAGKLSVYCTASWLPAYFNKTLQNNFRAGAGLSFRFGRKLAA